MAHLLEGSVRCSGDVVRDPARTFASRKSMWSSCASASGRFRRHLAGAVSLATATSRGAGESASGFDPDRPVIVGLGSRQRQTTLAALPLGQRLVDLEDFRDVFKRFDERRNLPRISIHRVLASIEGGERKTHVLAKAVD